jgi:drug/metabolite transporter (DMT)-like permease
MLWEPVVGVVLAALLLHEALVPAQLLGGVFVLGAAFMLQVSSDAANEPVAGVVEVV